MGDEVRATIENSRFRQASPELMVYEGEFRQPWAPSCALLLSSTPSIPIAPPQEGVGEIHFGWVLEGRAIQDVWILPGVFYGTTLRVYDPSIDAWHILWSDPVRQYYSRQIGRARGRDIVQEGRNDAGAAVRWTFTDIAPDAFTWLGERSQDGGASWQRQARFLARRCAV